MTDPFVPVGFDYAQALLRIRRVRTYVQIAEFCGFNCKQDIGRIINEGYIPRHPQGEAIWALHVQLFHEKPPMAQDQATGSFVAPVRRTKAVAAV